MQVSQYIVAHARTLALFTHWQYRAIHTCKKLHIDPLRNPKASWATRRNRCDCDVHKQLDKMM